LEQWSIGDRLLSARLDGADLDACIAAEIARGGLPPGSLRQPILRRLRPRVERLVHAAGDVLGTEPPRAVDGRGPLPDRPPRAGCWAARCRAFAATWSPRPATRGSPRSIAWSPGRSCCPWRPIPTAGSRRRRSAAAAATPRPTPT